jgi:ABC-type sugar transport system ATPase subunit
MSNHLETILANSQNSNARNTACSVEGIRKNYGGVKALVGVDLEVYPGLIHAIVGENGAGKSTLMKILVGAEQPDYGTVFVNGESVSFANVKEANKNGVAIVFQELSLFPDLDILANLFLLKEPLKYGVLVSRSEMKHQAQTILDELGLQVNLNTPIRALRLDEQQLIEIAKALLAQSNVLILDEPNSALNAVESQRLFKIIRQLRDKGVSIIYISHRLKEVFEIADVITVMRNGEIVNTKKTVETTIPEIVSLMIGEEKGVIQSEEVHHRSVIREETIEIENMTVKDKVFDINLKAYAGEIVGLAGLEGAGVETIFDVIYGQCIPDKGTVKLPGGMHAARNITEAVNQRIAYLPADRRKQSVMLHQSVLDNLSQVTAGVLGDFGFLLRKDKLERRAQSRSEALNIVMESLQSRINQLSGGNQQKVALGKWLEAEPRVFLLNDPTRGVDVGAKGEIYKIIEALAEKGLIVLFTSSELPEFSRLCDRVFVFFEGKICAELSNDLINEQTLLETINTGIFTNNQLS